MIDPTPPAGQTSPLPPVDPAPPITSYYTPISAPITSPLVGLIISWSGLTLITIGAAVFVLPRYDQIFKDFKTNLPGTTVAVLAAGRVIAGGGWVLLLPIPVVVPFALNSLTMNGRRGLGISVTALAWFLVIGSMICALFAPVFR